MQLGYFTNFHLLYLSCKLCVIYLPSSVFILDEPSAFYAEELFDATEGLGTNDEKLQRIFVLRAEVQQLQTLLIIRLLRST